MRRKRFLILAACALLLLASVLYAQIKHRGSQIGITNTGDITIAPASGRGITAVGKFNTCLDAGSTDAYACSLTPALGSYIIGQIVHFKAATANTGAATLAVNGLAAKTIKKAAGGITTDLATNDIRAGQYVELQYDGTNFQMLSASGNVDGGGTVTTVSVATANGISGSSSGGATPALTLTLGAITPSSVTVGSGTAVTRIAYYTATLSPAQVGADTCAEELFTVTGITAGDVVFVNKPTAQAGLGVAGVRASAADQVGINFCNTTAAPITPTASQAYLFGAIR